MAATAQYTPLSMDEDKSPERSGDWFSKCCDFYLSELCPADWFLYPGDKRSNDDANLKSSTGPPCGCVLRKTGGNALQAIDERVLEQKDLVEVVIPDGVKPGGSMMVKCPDGSGRMVSVPVPRGALPGFIVLVKVPPPPLDQPVIATGVPVANCRNDDKWQVIESDDFAPATVEDDLILREEESPQKQNQETWNDEEFDHDFEMVPNKHSIV